MKLWGTCASDDATLLAGSNHQSLLEIFGWMRDAEDNREGPAGVADEGNDANHARHFAIVARVWHGA